MTVRNCLRSLSQTKCVVMSQTKMFTAEKTDVRKYTNKVSRPYNNLRVVALWDWQLPQGRAGGLVNNRPTSTSHQHVPLRLVLPIAGIVEVTSKHL